MTTEQLEHDAGSYSTRSCRCGSAMLRTTGAAEGRDRWECPACGRRRRR